MDLNELSKNPEQIKQLISLLQNLLPTQTDEIVDESESVDQNNSPIRSKKAIREEKKPSQNKFLSMPEMNMHKEDTALDKQLSKHPPVARAREYEPASVRCRVCGKTEMVNPALVESIARYKCNKCATSAG